MEEKELKQQIEEGAKAAVDIVEPVLSRLCEKLPDRAVCFVPVVVVVVAGNKDTR